MLDQIFAFLLSVFVGAVSNALEIAGIFAALLVLEWALPKERHSVHGRLKAGVFWSISIVATALLATIFWKVWRQLGIQPLLVVEFSYLPGWASTAGSILTATLVGDFFFYWRHRLQHALFWRYHSVHHAIEELNAVSSYHHPSEEIFRLVFVVVPTAMIFDLPTTGAASLIFLAQGFYLHSSTRLHLGPLRYLIGDNAFHRIHHSTQSAHHGRNFSAIYPLWDVVFGTAYFPQKDEWPATGLTEARESADVTSYLLAPWRYPSPAFANPAEQAESTFTETPFSESHESNSAASVVIH